MEEESDGGQAQTHESRFGLPCWALEAIRSHARLFGCLRSAASQTPFELSRIGTRGLKTEVVRDRDDLSLSVATRGCV